MLSQRDKSVLQMILNPNLPFADIDETAAEKKEEATNAEEDDDHHRYSELPNYEESEAQNMEGIRLAESGDLDAALLHFNRAIELCPSSPSPYNNRAQLYGLQSKTDEALADLHLALELSRGQGRTAAQSFVQRALIHRLQGEDELAKEQFEKAAALGSNFAKNQLVAMNPYAAMCNQMLSEVMTKFQKRD